MQTMKEMVRENYQDKQRQQKYEITMLRKIKRLEKQVQKAARQGYSSLRTDVLFTDSDDLEYIADKFRQLGYYVTVGHYSRTVTIGWDKIIK